MTMPNSGQGRRGIRLRGMVDLEGWAGACGLHVVYARPQMEAPAAAPGTTAFAMAQTAGRKVLPTLMTPARQFQ